MTIKKLMMTAGLIAATFGVSASADAQRYNGDRDHGRYEQRDRGHDDRRYNKGNRGHHYGRDRHQRCRTEWRHHRRVQVCR